MIMHKMWTSHRVGKWNQYLIDGKYYSTKESYWFGWFLFGIIPLYIRNIENRYSSKR